jgi:hypothetical protein
MSSIARYTSVSRAAGSGSRAAGSIDSAAIQHDLAKRL